MAIKQGHEIPTIDVALVTIGSTNEIAIKTASKIQVEPQITTVEGKPLVIGGRLIAQKPEQSTLTGNKVTLTDNVLIPEVVKILQGGTIKYWTDAEHTTSGDTDAGFGISQYTPPVVGSGIKGESFPLNAYSAIYGTDGNISGYEKITYPNCKGTPVGLNTENDVFRAPEYVINSAPKKDEAPYDINYVDNLPEITQ